VAHRIVGAVAHFEVGANRSDVLRGWLFFEPRPSLALPGLHGLFVALNGATLWLLRREPQATQDSPDLCLAELDAVLSAPIQI
jgi:hypothetical protein